MARRKQTAIVTLTLRLREPLRKRIETNAKRRGVSLNAETVTRLEQSFRADQDDKIIALLERIEATLIRIAAAGGR